MAVGPELVVAADVAQSATLMCSVLAYLPQWHRLTSTQCSANISVFMWLIWLCSALLGLFYAYVQHQLTGECHLLVLTSLCTLGCVVITLVLVLKYKPSEKISRPIQ